MKSLSQLFHKNKQIIGLILLGVSLRLLFMFLFNHIIDFMNILAVTRSVAETGSVSGGFLAVSRLMHDPQLYGKIYYQVAALWLLFLQKIKILQIQFLFDTKPYSGLSSYLVGLGQWSPPLYQLISIKFIQFFWDFLFLFFLYQLAKTLGIRKLNYVILFWALNPFFMIITYAVFMPEIAMMMSLLGGVFFWLRALKNKGHVLIKPDVVLSIGFFSLGAVIKQVPILFIPFVIISCSESLSSFTLYSIISLLLYSFFGQPWSADALFIKQFSLFSTESLSIFRFTINNIPVFILLYGFLFLYSLANKKQFLTSDKKILFLVILILCIVYVCDSLFFVQFLIWILPFTALLALIDEQAIWVLSLSLLGVLIKAIASSDYFSSLASPTIGALYSDHLTNNELLKNIINLDLYNILIYSSNIFVYLIIGIYSISRLLEIKNKISQWFTDNIRFKFTTIVILFFFLYLVCVLVDFGIKHRYILLPQVNYQVSNNQVPLSNKPLQVTVYNPRHKTITAVEIPIMVKGTLQSDTTTFVFKNNNKMLDTEKVNDFSLPTNTDDPYLLYLRHSFNSSMFTLEIYKEQNINEVSLLESKTISGVNVPRNGLYKGYDEPNNNELLSLRYPDKNFALAFRGVYGWQEILNSLKFTMRTKRHLAYFLVYFILTVSTLFAGIYLVKSRKN